MSQTEAYETSSAHAEGAIPEYAISTTRFSGENGQVKKLHAKRATVPVPHARWSGRGARE